MTTATIAALRTSLCHGFGNIRFIAGQHAEIYRRAWRVDLQATRRAATQVVRGTRPHETACSDSCASLPLNTSTHPCTGGLLGPAGGDGKCLEGGLNQLALSEQSFCFSRVGKLRVKQYLPLPADGPEQPRHSWPFKEQQPGIQRDVVSFSPSAKLQSMVRQAVSQ